MSSSEEEPGEKGKKGEIFLLSGKQLIAAKALIAGANIKKAADEAGVTDRTITNWLADPSFTGPLNAMQLEALNQSARYMATTTRAAAAVLVDVMMCREFTPANNQRMRAAQILLDTALKYAEVTTFKDELDQIKELLKVENTDRN